MQTGTFGSGTVIIHGHGHQPHRVLPYLRNPHTLRAIPSTEKSAIQAASGKCVNWTAVALQESYGPLMGKGPDQSAYRQISFNFSPILLEQLKVFDYEFIKNLKKSDMLSIKDQEGHGNAVATGFDHVILPLAIRSDREIQIGWGIEHFKHSFGRGPEGFWLPEAAVDAQTLETLSSFGIQFVILSPSQVKKVRGEAGWQPIWYKDGFPMMEDRKPVETGKPYRIKTPGGREIAVFLYNPYLLKELAYGELLNSGGDSLTTQIYYQLCNYPFVGATVDIETFGHHKKGGVQTLFDYLAKTSEHKHRLTNYGRLLAEARKTPEVMTDLELRFPSSWSCAHGVGRWSKDCGCERSNPWRWFLRSALVDLAKRADGVFDKVTDKWLRDPEGAKLRYIHVLLGITTFEEFLSQEQRANKVISSSKFEKLSGIFDSLVSRQAMFVSCAWFFRGMRMEAGYALAQAADLIKRIKHLDPELELDFIRQLANVINVPDVAEGNGLHNAAQAYFQAKDAQGAAESFIRGRR